MYLIEKYGLFQFADRAKAKNKKLLGHVRRSSKVKALFSFGWNIMSFLEICGAWW